MKKIMLLIILSLSIVGCELLSPKLWKEAHQDRVNRGEVCYERADGTVYCKDKYGNRVY